MDLSEIHREGKQVNTAEHGRLLLRAAGGLVQSRRGVSMEGVSGAPAWYGYEIALWETSEDLRFYLRKNPRLRGVNELFDSVAAIVADGRFGKGRQNFVLVLGQFGGVAYETTIARSLYDDETAAHGLQALRGLGLGGYVQRARELEADPPTGATRREARKYLKAFASSEAF